MIWEVFQWHKMAFQWHGVSDTGILMQPSPVSGEGCSDQVQGECPVIYLHRFSTSLFSSSSVTVRVSPSTVYCISSDSSSNMSVSVPSFA